MAGAERIELPTHGFGDHRSTCCATLPCIPARDEQEGRPGPDSNRHGRGLEASGSAIELPSHGPAWSKSGRVSYKEAHHRGDSVWDAQQSALAFVLVRSRARCVIPKLSQYDNTMSHRLFPYSNILFSARFCRKVSREKSYPQFPPCFFSLSPSMKTRLICMGIALSPNMAPVRRRRAFFASLRQ